MGAKVYADRLSSPDGASPPSASPPSVSEGELEAEVQAVSAWFDALPAEWRSYFDREAESGRRAYGQA
jgi:hypothetical protein